MARVRVCCLRELAKGSAVAAMILSIACAKDLDRLVTPPPEPAAGPVASVELQLQTTTLPWSFSMSVTAVPKNADGQVLVGPTATWTSSDMDRVQLTRYQGESGSLSAEARAVGVGDVTITATVEGKRAEARISAVLPPNLPVGVWPDTSRIPLSGRRVLGVQRFGGLNRSPMTIAAGVTWESSDPTVATVDNDGAVTAVGEGHTTITAIADNRRFSAEVLVFRYPSTIELTSVSAGDRHACGLTSTGAAYCWGHNDYGQLGIDVAMDRCATFVTAGGGIFGTRFFRCSEAPVPVNTSLRFASISAGLRQTCALTTDGSAYCWGANINGQSGTGVADTILRTPTRVASGETFRSIDVGRNAQACAITTSKSAYCWGNNFTGALGDGSRENRMVPTAVAGGHSWKVIHAGLTTCGLTTEDIPYCWGANRIGEAGIPPSTEPTSPTRVVGDLRFKQLGSSCGLVADGSAYCWGTIWGGVITYTPTPLTEGLSFARLARGSRCGVAVDGQTYCWGLPPSLMTPARSQPTFPIGALDVGSGIACAIDLGGTAYCWGDAGSGFWQNDSFFSSSGVPRRVAGQR